jgi:hypothetical protein
MLLQKVVIPIGRQWPGQTGLFGTKQIVSDRATGNVAAFGNLFIG